MQKRISGFLLLDCFPIFSMSLCRSVRIPWAWQPKAWMMTVVFMLWEEIQSTYRWTRKKSFKQHWISLKLVQSRHNMSPCRIFLIMIAEPTSAIIERTEGHPLYRLPVFCRTNTGKNNHSHWYSHLSWIFNNQLTYDLPQPTTLFSLARFVSSIKSTTCTQDTVYLLVQAASPSSTVLCPRGPVSLLKLDLKLISHLSPSDCSLCFLWLIWTQLYMFSTHWHTFIYFFSIPLVVFCIFFPILPFFFITLWLMWVVFFNVLYPSSFPEGGILKQETQETDTDSYS